MRFPIAFLLLLLAASAAAAQTAPPGPPATGDAAPAGESGAIFASPGNPEFRLRAMGSLASLQVVLALPEPLLGEGSPGTAGKEMAEVARNDLYFTGVFQIVEPSYYTLVPRSLEPVPFKEWRSIGARYLAESRLSRSGNQLALEGMLFNLDTGEMLFREIYRGEDRIARRIAHRFAERILFYFTSEKVSFTTRLAYVSRRGATQEVYVADYDGAGEKKITESGSICLSPALSPDGDWLAFVSFARGRPDLYLLEKASGALSTFFSRPGVNQSPSFSPDGEWIAFSSSTDGNPEIYRARKDRSGLLRLTDNSADDLSPSWSPSGREIAFCSNRSGSPQIYKMDRDGLNVARLTYGTDYASDPAWSPLGDRIAFSSRVQGVFHVCILDLETQETTCLVPGEDPAWSPDGRFLAYVAREGGRSAIYVMRADGGMPRRVSGRGDSKTPSWMR